MILSTIVNLYCELSCGIPFFLFSIITERVIVKITTTNKRVIIINDTMMAMGEELELPVD